MTFLRLLTREARYLTSFPESGMGFQIIELGLQRKRRALYLVLGSRFLIPAADPESAWAALSELDGWTAERLETSDEVEEARLTDGPLGNYSGPAERPSLRASLLDPGVHWSEVGRALLRAPEVVKPGVATGLRRYVRYSPFPTDYRVLPDGTFAPGSYAAPADDPDDPGHAPGGAAPAERYAMPAPFPTPHEFTVVTTTPATWTGVSVANFGRVGGGTQCFFKGRMTPALQESPGG